MIKHIYNSEIFYKNASLLQKFKNEIFSFTFLIKNNFLSVWWNEVSCLWKWKCQINLLMLIDSLASRVENAPVSPITKRFLAGSLSGKLGLYCMAGNRPGWLVTRPGQVGNRQNQPRIKFIVRNWLGTSRALVKYWLRVDSEWKFSLESFGITRFSSESDSGMARNSADWFGINFNPELSLGWTYMMFKNFFKFSKMLRSSFP